MSYPLIQNPAPLQQLAQTIQAIRADRDARLAAAEERRLAVARDQRAEQYLEMNRQSNAARQMHDAATLEMARARFALQQQDTLANRAAAARAERLAMRTARLNEAVAPVDRPRVGNVGPLLDQAEGAAASRAVAPVINTMLPGVGDAMAQFPEPDIAGQVAQARERSRPGLEGSAIRAPQMGTSDLGVTYSPDTANYNQPSGGAGGRGPTTQDLLMRAAITGAYQQMQSMEQMESADPESARVPGAYNTIEEAGNIPAVGGMLRGALEPVAQQTLTPNQQAYMAMRREFIHTYASSLPGRRLGPELLKLLEVAFFPRAGQSDPGTLATYRQRRREAADRMYRAVQGEPIDLESVLPPDIIAAMNGAQPAPGAPTAGGGMAPSGPRINPRFMR